MMEGNVLADQTEFVNDCIKLILQKYNSTENLAKNSASFTVL